MVSSDLAMALLRGEIHAPEQVRAFIENHVTASGGSPTGTAR
jgi:hypothetical protein